MHTIGLQIAGLYCQPFFSQFSKAKTSKGHFQSQIDHSTIPSCHVPCSPCTWAPCPTGRLPCPTDSAAMSHGSGCHVPRISFREGLSRQGKGVSSAKLTAVFNLLLMSYDMPSAQLPCFHPSRRPTWGDAGWPLANPQTQSPAYKFAVRGVGCMHPLHEWVHSLVGYAYFVVHWTIYI